MECNEYYYPLIYQEKDHPKMYFLVSEDGVKAFPEGYPTLDELISYAEKKRIDRECIKKEIPEDVLSKFIGSTFDSRWIKPVELKNRN